MTIQKGKGEDQRIVELREILAEQESYSSVGSVKLVTEAIAYVQDRGYLTETGALSDTLAPPGTASEKRHWLSLAAALFAQRISSEPAKINRRSFLSNAVAGIFGTVVGGYLLYRAEEPETYDEAFIRRILRLHSSRPELHNWQRELFDSGRMREADLIGCLSVHGEGFQKAFEGIVQLHDIISDAKLSPFSRTYLHINYATHHRYLGLVKQAFNLIDPTIDLKRFDPQLQVLVLNHRHMGRYQVVEPLSDLPIALQQENQDLATGMSHFLTYEAGSMARASFNEAYEISVECIALKGVYLMNECMASTSEVVALDVLDLLDQFRKGIVETLILPEVDAGRDWMAVRLYGEAVWNYSRIAPVAFLKGWDRVLARCVASFYDPESATSEAEKEVMARYHVEEGRKLRSPLWIQMGFLKSSLDQVSSGTGDRTLSRTIPEDFRYRITHHGILLRTFNSLSVTFGTNPLDIDPNEALVSVESKLLLDCVREMHRRMGASRPI
jgi:hypothetical protein